MTRFNPDDPKWTAYILGELNESERAVVEVELAASREARMLVEELRLAADLTRTELREQTPLVSLSREQREAICASSGFTTPRRWLGARPMVWAAGLAAASIALIVAVTPHTLRKSGGDLRSVTVPVETDHLQESSQAAQDLKPEPPRSPVGAVRDALRDAPKLPALAPPPPQPESLIAEAKAKKTTGNPTAGAAVAVEGGIQTSVAQSAENRIAELAFDTGLGVRSLAAPPSPPARSFSSVVPALQNAPVPKSPALIQASVLGDVDRVRALLKSGADLLGRDDHGGTALHAAATGQQQATFVGMLDFVLAPVGALVPEIAKDSQIAVGEAVLALDRRTRILNAVDENGSTALMLVARNGWRDVVTTLVDHGADPTIRDKAGRSAADYAETAGHAELSNYLRQFKGRTP